MFHNVLVISVSTRDVGNQIVIKEIMTSLAQTPGFQSILYFTAVVNEVSQVRE